MTIKWRTDMPNLDEAILAIVETKGGTRYFVCEVDENETLCDLEFGDDYGWQMESIDRWVSLSDLDAHLEGFSDNPPSGEKETK